jgi:zinc protease
MTVPEGYADLLARLNAAASGETAQVRWLDGHAIGDGARVDRFALGNGLEIIVWPSHDAPVASYHTWFRVGSRDDPRGRTGLAHLFEHMMFKATRTRAEGEFDRIMEGLGAQTNAATWVDWTNYHAKVLAEDVATVAELESDRMSALALSPDMLAREREVVKNERVMRVDDDPEGQLSEAVYKALFPAHAYGEPTIGWMADIDAIDLDDCGYFYRTWYSATNAVIVVCGDVALEPLLAKLQGCYGALSRVDVPARAAGTLATAPDLTTPVRCEAPVLAARLVRAWRGPGVSEPAHAALQVASEILAGSDAARLVMRLVEDLELATDVSCGVTPWALASAFEVAVTLRPGASVAEVDAVLDAELARFRAEGPTVAEVERARNGLETDFWRGLADVNGRANQLGHAHVTAGDYRDLWREAERLLAVTQGDVTAAVNAFLVPDAAVCGLLEPLPDSPDDGDGDGDEDDDQDADEGPEVTA